MPDRGGEILGRFGIASDVEAIWRALIEVGTASIDDLTVLTAQTSEAVLGAVEQLLVEGLVSRGPADGDLRAVEPTLAIEGRLGQAERRLADELEELRQIRTQLPDLSQRHARSQSARTMSAHVDIILESAEVRRHANLASQRTKIICRCMVRQGTARSMREAYPSVVDLGSRGVEQRTLVTSDFLADTERFAESVKMQEAGDTQRSLPELPTHMFIYDDNLAVLPLVPDQLSRGAMLVHERGVIEPLIALFDQLWSTAQPVFAPSSDELNLSPRVSRVLELVAAGATDDHISRSLGVTTRTVRREVATLRDALGVGSRMEIVPAAVRRGWL